MAWHVWASRRHTSIGSGNRRVEADHSPADGWGFLMQFGSRELWSLFGHIPLDGSEDDLDDKLVLYILYGAVQKKTKTKNKRSQNRDVN